AADVRAGIPRVFQSRRKAVYRGYDRPRRRQPAPGSHHDRAGAALSAGRKWVVRLCAAVTSGGSVNVYTGSEDMQPNSTRRSFVRGGGGGGTARAGSARPAVETLAISGGPKTVTIPASQQAEITKWPRYGDQEKKAILELLDNNRSYAEIPLLEKE